jgi:Protein of unknown function (DUF2442)
MSPERKPRTAQSEEREFRRARGRGAVEAANPMRAVAAAYDRETGRILLELANGCLFGFPPALVEGLDSTDVRQIESVTVEGGGTALRWEDLDIDLLVAPLVAGVFGTRSWMRELGRRGGSATSKAKKRAARANGKKGGRPRRSRATRELSGARHADATPPA